MHMFEKNDSFFQTLHPITIISYLFVIIAGTIIASNPIILLGFMAAVAFAIAAAKCIHSWAKSLRVYSYMIMTLVLINVLINNTGATVLWAGPFLPIIGSITITLEAITFGIVMGFRLLIVFSAFILYNRVMDPDKALSVFSKVFPKSALLIALTTKTIPFMGEQLKRAAEIQQCRGVQYHTGSFITRIKNRLPLTKVLLLSSLEDSFSLGESIQARAYGSGPRSSYYTLSYYTGDIIVLACSITAFTSMLWLVIKGWAAMEFYPRLGELLVSGEQLLMTITILFLVMLPVIVAWGWEKWHL